jgi:hypothetical protein
MLTPYVINAQNACNPPALPFTACPAPQCAFLLLGSRLRATGGRALPCATAAASRQPLPAAGLPKPGARGRQVSVLFEFTSAVFAVSIRHQSQAEKGSAPTAFPTEVPGCVAPLVWSKTSRSKTPYFQALCARHVQGTDDATSIIICSSRS